MTTEEQITGVVLDYVEGWFDGSADRMERALHPDLVKRCRGIEGDDPDALENLTQGEMVDATAQGADVKRTPPTAGSRSRSPTWARASRASPAFPACYVDLLHVIRMPEGWRIVNAAWELR